MKSGIFLDEIYKEIRKKVAFAKKDRVFADDIEKGIEMIKDKIIIKVIDRVKKRKKLKFQIPHSKEFEVF